MGDSTAILKSNGANLACFKFLQLKSEIMITDILDCKLICSYVRGLRLTARMKIGSNAKVVIQGGLWATPDAEKVYLTADFFTPLAVVVSG